MRGPALRKPLEEAGEVDLSAEMGALADRIASAGDGAARAIQFVSAKAGEGASTVAREFARALVGRGGKGVWLVELDLMAGAQYAALLAGGESLGEPLRASPNRTSFFQVVPPTAGVAGRPWSDASYLAAYPVGEERFWVTRFRREALVRGQTVRITGGGEFWQALRAHADYIVVDAPAAERSRAAAAVARHMDASVIVVSAGNGDARGPQLLRDGLEAAGGRCAGVVLNRAHQPAPDFLRALLP